MKDEICESWEKPILPVAFTWEEVEAAWQRFIVSTKAAPPRGIMRNTVVEKREDKILDHLVYQLMVFILSKVVYEDSYEYPADWVQAVKERFAPRWFKDRWPVRYTRICQQITHICPHLDDEYRGKHIEYLRSEPATNWVKEVLEKNASGNDYKNEVLGELPPGFRERSKDGR